MNKLFFITSQRLCQLVSVLTVRKSNPFFLLLIVLILVGCGKSKPSADVSNNNVPSDLSSQEILNNSSVQGDYERGRQLFLQCRACHSLKINESHKVGPNLYRILGQESGNQEGFDYSDALMSSKILWNIDTLDQFLQKPYAFIPGNRMVFAGLKNASDRLDIISYLVEETAEKNQ
ncbi:MAG TPA: c-type cytochrome [Gammaproteobacteria bacterium]|nr:c-type cytochrome [Gammaproteobacteria bacterium]